MMAITIFDYDVTEEEIKNLFVHFLDRQEYVEKTSYKKKLQDLYVLFKMREDKVRAGEVMNEMNKVNEVNAA